MPKSRIQSNRLTVLAADIRAAHNEIESSALAMAERVQTAGSALTEAKALIPHGGWQAWLTTHTGLSARTARRYMQIADSGMETATVASLGIKAAAAALARNTPPKSRADDDAAYDVWLAEITALVDRVDANVPGFRATFVGWCKTRRAADAYADRARTSAADDELPALNGIIEAEQAHSLRQFSTRRSGRGH